MQKLAKVRGVTVYDDFAHHPTAIASTLDGLRKQVGTQRIIAVIEPRSNSMKLGAHREGLAPSTVDAARRLLWQIFQCFLCFVLHIKQMVGL